MSIEVRVKEVFEDLSKALEDSKIVSIRRPRKWRGDDFTARQIPIAVVTVDCYNKQKVFDTVGEVASRNHVATMANSGYRNSRSEILLYINLKKSEIPELVPTAAEKAAEILMLTRRIKEDKKRLAELQS